MITIRPSRSEDVSGLHQLLQSVIEERQYLGAVHAPPILNFEKFLQRLWREGVGQLVAEAEGQVIGWCDAGRTQEDGFRHNATLGMGVHRIWRGRGIGRQLLTGMLARCEQAGIQRVELSVYASNLPAIHLYETHGFVREGVRARQRYLDGNYDDVVLMARFFGSCIDA